MSKTTYMPFLSSIANNYRDSLDAVGVSTMNYTDEELIAVINFWQGMSTSEEQFDAVMQDVTDNTKR